MKILKRSAREYAKVSIVLLDWSVRESFHLLYYLRNQAVSRERFEVIVVEYYSTVSPAAQRFADQIDTWILLEMPLGCYYHKHLMYNAGIALGRGDVCVFCDSDAMVKSTFVQTIMSEFERDPEIVLHLDQFRNMRRDFYPFCFPSFEDVVGPGCINNVDGKTRGLADSNDPLHERNYGACMCGRREDLIAIGGADEHIDYLGHICGPYEMTFRLVNFGRRELWHPSEFMYHTWHPGQAGVGNYLGPHDGRHMSTTALEALTTGRVHPYDENPAIRQLREDGLASDVSPMLVARRDVRQWTLDGVSRLVGEARSSRTVLYRGFKIDRQGAGFTAQLLLNDVLRTPATPTLYATTLADAKAQIARAVGLRVGVVSAGGSGYVLAWRGLSTAWIAAGRTARVARSLPGRVMRATIAAIRKARARWEQFVLERRFLSGSLASLLVNIHFIGELRRAASVDVPPPVVIVERRALFNYLKLVGAARLIAPLDVVRINNAADVDRWVRTLVEIDAGSHIIVGRDFYLRHYGSLSRLRAMKRLVVA